jgi:DNA-binding LytR/AlgR family response regulator
MFRIALCDDNDKFLDMEERIIRQYLDLCRTEYHIERFVGGQALLDLGQEINQCQLIFLDVEMEELGGIETARKIREYSEVPIAFVTAYISYSLEGYKVNAVRYILKEMVSFRAGICECLDLIMNRNQNAETERLVLELREGTKEILLTDLIYIESRHHYCYFHIRESGTSNIYTKREKLDEIEAQLHEESLLRIHKSCLVNLSFVSDVKRYQVQLTTGEILLVAQSKYLDVERSYLNYCGRMD